MSKIRYAEVPRNYPLCVKADCPMADHCLRQIAMGEISKHDNVMTIVNPLRTKPSEQCESYRSNELQTFARGFTKMQEVMLPRQYKTFMLQLQSHFGRTAYFERRRGERLCSPRDIKVIEAVLQSLGLPRLEFDAYEQHLCWTE